MVPRRLLFLLTLLSSVARPSTFAHFPKTDGPSHTQQLATVLIRPSARALWSGPFDAAVGGLVEREQDAGRWTGADNRRQVIIDQRAQALRAKHSAPESDVLALVAAYGGEILSRHVLTSTFTVRISVAGAVALSRDPQIHAVQVLRRPATQIDLHAIADQLVDESGMPLSFWAAGETGGSFDFGIIDAVSSFDEDGNLVGYGGIETGHPRLDHVRYELAPPNTQPTALSSHPTSVAGIVYSDDVTVRGYAFGLDTVLVGDCVANAIADLEWMFDGATQAPEVINESCGVSRFSADGPVDQTDYSASAQARDVIIDAFDVVYAHAAGNDGPLEATLLTDISYNDLTVANVFDQNTIDRLDDRVFDQSSRGPTPLGRRKPDIAAPGHMSRTTRFAGQEDTGGCSGCFWQLGGTSAATAHVSGASMLLVDALEAPGALVIKAVLINSAQAWTDNGTPGESSDDGPLSGRHWSPSYGYGYMDVGAAWVERENYLVSQFAAVPRSTPAAGTQYFLGALDPGDKVTLVWNKHDSMPLTNLDLALNLSSNGQPADQSTSSIDNVEQVALPASGDDASTVIVRVLRRHTTDVPEAFALAGGRLRPVSGVKLTDAVLPGVIVAEVPGSTEILAGNESGHFALNASGQLVAGLGQIPVRAFLLQIATASGPAELVVEVEAERILGDSFEGADAQRIRRR